MERGAATRGKGARDVAGAEAIEIKVTIPDRQIGQALARFRLAASNDEERYIYFSDTPKLDLLGGGIIARARRVVGDAHDSTVKFRPIDVEARGRQADDGAFDQGARRPRRGSRGRLHGLPG